MSVSLDKAPHNVCTPGMVTRLPEIRAAYAAGDNPNRRVELTGAGVRNGVRLGYLTRAEGAHIMAELSPGNGRYPAFMGRD